MKRVVVLGDIHGYNAIPLLEFWKDADAIILVGDYLDSYDQIDPIEQIENARQIFEFVDAHPNMITLLGNHDLHYIIPEQEASTRRFLGDSFDKACNLLKNRYDAGKLPLWYKQKEYIVSHAGITTTWLNNRYDDTNLLASVKYWNEDATGFGAHLMQGPCWIRPSWAIPKAYKDILGWKTLEDDPWSIHYQIVGHTRTKQVMKIDNIIYCDCLAIEHVLIEIPDEGEIKFKAVNSKTLEQRPLT